MMRGASVIGHEHVRLARNNQDAWAAAEHAGAECIVVCDGCSSEACSEVGAQLAAQWLAKWCAAHAAAQVLDAAFVVKATKAMTAWLYRLEGAFELGESTDRYVLFTFLCAVAKDGRFVVFGIGDGAVWVDDRLVRLDAGPQNAPNYLAYRLRAGAAPEAEVHFVGEARRVVLMTDGFEAVAEAVPQMVSTLGPNPLTLQRRLNVFSAEHRLSDDATLAALSLEA